MAHVDVSRIVPSTRDLLAALQTQRKSLALVPLIDGEPQSEAARLDALDVRAFAVETADDALMALARSTRATPSLCLAPASTSEDCQRARFHGADGVCLVCEDTDHWDKLSKMARSMRLMALASARDLEAAERAVTWGARAVMLSCDLDTAATAGERIARPTMLVAQVEGLTVEGLERLNGAVDAVILPASIHAGGQLEALLDRLDG